MLTDCFTCIHTDRCDQEDRWRGCINYQMMPTTNPKPQTNADRIRAMTDEELAEYLFDRGNCQEYCYGICDVQDECNGSPSDAYCISHIVKWLNKEVNDG